MTAVLLYLVTKNHSFTDGNKRIAATLFLWFMENNGILYAEDWGKRIADIRSLKEAWLDTTTPHGKLLFTISAGISQFERDLTHERTMDGLAAARARGRLGGRPKSDEKKIRQAMAMYDANNHILEKLCKLTPSGLSKLTPVFLLNFCQQHSLYQDRRMIPHFQSTRRESLSRGISTRGPEGTCLALGPGRNVRDVTLQRS